MSNIWTERQSSVKKVDSVGVCDEQLTQGTVGIKTVTLDSSVLRG